MRRFITVSLMLACILLPGSAAAYTLLEDGDLKLSMGGLARLGWVFQDAGGDFSQDPFLQYARLSGSIEHTTWGKGYVRIEGNSGNAELLDAYVELRPSPYLKLKGGIYRRYTTADYMQGGRKIPFAQRSMLRVLNEERLPGIEAIGKIPAGIMDIDLQVGWFVPEPEEIALLPDGEGNYLSGRLAFNFEGGFMVHFTYFGLVLGDNALVPDPDDPTAPLVQPVPYPNTFDFALRYLTDTWHLQAEVLLSPNDQDASDDLNWGAYAFGLYRFPIFGEMELGPGVRYGILERDGATTHRVTTGAALYIVDDYFKFVPNYDLSVADGELGHTVWLTMHGGF